MRTNSGDQQGKERRIFYPNTYQSPNFLTDELMPLLSGPEWKVLTFAVRKTLGWHKHSDEISIAAFQKGCGLGRETVVKAVRALTKFGVLIKEGRGKYGTSYRLNISASNGQGEAVDVGGLQARRETERQRQVARTETARRAKGQAECLPVPQRNEAKEERAQESVQQTNESLSNRPIKTYYTKPTNTPSEYRGGKNAPSPDPSEEKVRDPPAPKGWQDEAMGMLRSRCEARGYSLRRSDAGRDGKDLKAMGAEGYSLEDIFTLWDKKAAEPRNEGRHVPMGWVREDIGPFVAAKRRGGNGDRGYSGLPSSCPKCFEEGEPLPGQTPQVPTNEGVRCSYLGCLYHQFRVTGKVSLPGRCTRWAEPTEAKMVAEAGAT